MVKFADIVAAKSGGKIKVKTYFGGTLGSDVTSVPQLQGGVLEMAVPECSILVGVNGLREFGLLNRPTGPPAHRPAAGLLRRRLHRVHRCDGGLYRRRCAHGVVFVATRAALGAGFC